MDFKGMISEVKPDVIVKVLAKAGVIMSPDKVLEVMSKVPVLRLIAYMEKGFNSMTEEQKIEFVKNCMIAAAKAAA